MPSDLTPNSDFVVIASCDKESSTWVDRNTPDRTYVKKHGRGTRRICSVELTFMLLKSVDQNTHAIIPKLHTAIMKRRREKRLCRVKCES
jgi:hypothetical protein